jgi:hypothetical protein
MVKEAHKHSQNKTMFRIAAELDTRQYRKDHLLEDGANVPNSLKVMVVSDVWEGTSMPLPSGLLYDGEGDGDGISGLMTRVTPVDGGKLYCMRAIVAFQDHDTVETFIIYGGPRGINIGPLLDSKYIDKERPSMSMPFMMIANGLDLPFEIQKLFKSGYDRKAMILLGTPDVMSHKYAKETIKNLDAATSEEEFLRVMLDLFGFDESNPEEAAIKAHAIELLKRQYSEHHSNESKKDDDDALVEELKKGLSELLEKEDE